MYKTIIQQPSTVSNALDALLDNMYVSGKNVKKISSRRCKLTTLRRTKLTTLRRRKLTTHKTYSIY